jgi:hypothetical protein
VTAKLVRRQSLADVLYNQQRAGDLLNDQPDPDDWVDADGRRRWKSPKRGPDPGFERTGNDQAARSVFARQQQRPRNSSQRACRKKSVDSQPGYRRCIRVDEKGGPSRFCWHVADRVVRDQQERTAVWGMVV